MNKLYLKVWGWSCEHQRIRWTVVTFFFGISFALFGFSLHRTTEAALVITERLAALAIYWFACLLFLRFHKYTDELRDYLLGLEKEHKTDYDLQTRLYERMRQGRMWKVGSTEGMIFVFGLLYTLAVVLVSVFVKVQAGPAPS